MRKKGKNTLFLSTKKPADLLQVFKKSQLLFHALSFISR